VGSGFPVATLKAPESTETISMRHSDRHSDHCLRARFSLTPLAAASVVLCCFVFLTASSVAKAQSGRRVSKGARAVTPLPPEPPKPTKPPAVKPDDRIELYVTLNERDPFQDIPIYLHDTIMRAFIQRLAESSSVKVTPGKELHRSEAIKHAKGETRVHVVLLQLDVDTFDTRRTGSANVDRNKLSIRYSVFAPVTGKSETEGVVYQQDYRVGRGVIGFPSPGNGSALYSDYLLKEAAREAANRVLSSLHIAQPPRPPGVAGN
jgi:hypothetical protein